MIDGGPGPDRLTDGAGEDTIRGGEGSDEIHGGARVDRLLGGAGDDRLSSTDDFFRDRVDCGTGADHATFERGERPIGCELAERVRPADAPMLVEDFSTLPPDDGPRYRVQRGRVALLLGCLDLITGCDATVDATVRVGRRRVTVLRTTIRCLEEPRVAREDCERAENPGARLTAAGRALLRRRGTLRARATLYLRPGPGRGALPIPARLVLRR